MSWHHHVSRAVRHNAMGFVAKHPYLTTLLAVVGLSTVATVATGAHATPSPAAQTPPPPKA